MNTHLTGAPNRSPSKTQLTHRIPDDLLARVDRFRAGYGLTRTAAINLLTAQALDVVEGAAQ